MDRLVNELLRPKGNPENKGTLRTNKAGACGKDHVSGTNLWTQRTCSAVYQSTSVMERRAAGSTSAPTDKSDEARPRSATGRCGPRHRNILPWDNLRDQSQQVFRLERLGQSVNSGDLDRHSEKVRCSASGLENHARHHDYGHVRLGRTSSAHDLLTIDLGEIEVDQRCGVVVARDGLKRIPTAGYGRYHVAL